MDRTAWEDNKIVQFPKDGGGGDMGDGNYVTHKELELAKESIERKIDSTESNLKTELSNIDHKIDTSIFTFKEELRKQKSANIKWIIGTSIGVISIIIGALKFFIR